MNSSKTDPTQCPKCLSSNLLRITGEAEKTVHYGRLVCADCGRFIKWVRDPGVCIAHMNRMPIIDELLKFNLGDWDKKFLTDIREQRVLTEKQQQQLNRIGEQRLKRTIGMLEPETKTAKSSNFPAQLLF